MKRVSKRRGTIDNQRLFKRASQIFGVPLNELVPPVVDRPLHGIRNKISSAVYFPSTHQIVYNKKHLTYPFMTHHEERHGLQFMMLPKKLVARFSRKMDHFLEVTNPSMPVIDTIRAPGIRKSILSAALVAATKPLGGVYPTLAFFLFYLPNIMNDINIRGIVRRHGEDGIILLYASPPRDAKGNVTFRFKRWENEMVRRNYLLPKGGFTREGMKYLREHIQSAELWKRFAAAKREREKE